MASPIELPITPGEPVVNIHCDTASLYIFRNDIVERYSGEPSIELTYENCIFNELNIRNNDPHKFKNVSVIFINCFIRDIVVEGVNEPNININFLGCIIAGTIEGRANLSVHFVNCVVGRDGLTLTNIKHCAISYDARAITAERKWVVSDFDTFISEQQRINLIDCRDIDFKGNLSDEVYRKPMEIALILNFMTTELCKANITGCVLDDLTISGNPQGKIAINMVRVGGIYLRDLIPADALTLYDVKPKATYYRGTRFEIHGCNLDKVWFDNVDFAGFNSVSFFRTKFAKTTFTACNLPENYISFEKFKALENIHYPEARTENYNKDQYEIFLQLKKSFESTGNYYEAQKIQSAAHEALRKIETISSWDRAILSINNVTNGHGLSIKKPFLLFLGNTIVFYVLYLLSIGRIFNSNEVDLRLIGYYFQFIDLTHRNDFLVSSVDQTNWSMCIDFFNKIIVGFLIYQFIAAFRKYGKSL
ncbi:MAG: hypothetical protein P0Y49_09275 [Candidatus Pedobacter colombiensis]|uniref:Uncharacterized protein n=1 Tax=Candidatus Pedobacter colombiensis TaxID=3121371 RepID=A0AAJ6B9C1_9SPHI|nr:hypothetical protein [Pedobacter sp.]WEK21331.1 MAG: hypothetical protein P0Y49_09275 [Pedobacter sp.]